MHKKFVAASAITAGLLTLTASGCSRPASAGPRPETQAALEIREKLLAGAADTAVREDAATEATGTGWGTLRGTFKFDGTPPTPGKLTVDKDLEVCGKGNGILNNSLLVASDGGIANIVLYARGAKRVHESAQPLSGDKAGTPVEFDQKGCMFLTHVLAVQVGQKIDVKNSDPLGHNTKIDPAKGLPFNQSVPFGSPLVYVPTAEEAFPATVACSIHPWMRAYLLPRKDKYFAVTTANGAFEIANLPAGEEVEIQVWHESAAGSQGALVLDRKDLNWTNKGRFKIKLDADKPTDLELIVPAAAFTFKQ
ncbi:MAG: hypothetical protein HY288_11270 [Planctomycetia bacterium]|nr:hypothetical protein [Planctomycetia bacterium]